MAKRITFDIVAFLTIFYAPWWFVLLLGGIGTLLFPRYYEIFFIGFIVDLTYSADTTFLRGTASLVASAIIFFAFSRLREMLR